MQFPNNNFMKFLNSFLITILFLAISSKSYSYDTIYVKFINKFIQSETFDVNSFRISNKTYILKQVNDSTLECYVIKGKILMSYGLLEIRIEKNTKVANRIEYWSFYKNSNYYETSYYYYDEKLNDEKIKATKEIGVFPPFSIKNLK